MHSKGLGDSIEKFTIATGIKSFAQMTTRAIGKEDCGCKKRKDWLNQRFSYKIKSLVKKVAGEDCGCNKRKEYLNKKFPYKPNYDNV